MSAATGRTVIVGAGSAGCVIAARLSERSDQEVVLLEAGPDYPGARPADLRDGTRNSYRTHDWAYSHRPTARSYLRSPLPRGRVVGGSSAINTCIALRGVPADFDEWAARGLPAWSWDRCLPAFKRLETDLDRDDEWHGRSGPLRVRRARDGELVPWQAAFLDACVSLGHPRTDDHNRPGALGVGPHTMNLIEGVRQDAASSFLTPEVRARANLRVLDHVLVHRVLFDTAGRASGVALERHGRRQELRCDRVVLSAGAIGTPALLLRSGVGPRSELARLGVRCVRDVPAIGARVLDHPGTAIFLWPRAPIVDLEGPLIQVALRMRSARSSFDGDLQIQAGSFWFLPVGRGASLPGVGVMMHVGKPQSAGTLRVRDLDPRSAPQIESRFFESAADRAVALEGMETARALLDSPALRDLAWVVWPRPDVLRDPARLAALLPHHCDSGYHPCGTVPMGEACDQHGRIADLEGLHVADASLMPTIPTANIHLAVLMIGERFGRWLRDGLDDH